MNAPVETTWGTLFSFGDALKAGEKNQARRMLKVLARGGSLSDIDEALEYFGFECVDLNGTDRIAVYQLNNLYLTVYGNFFDGPCRVEFNAEGEK